MGKRERKRANPIFSVESKRSQHRRHNVCYRSDSVYARPMPLHRERASCEVRGVIFGNVGPQFPSRNRFRQTSWKTLV
jgi:hypothetical protein